MVDWQFVRNGRRLVKKERKILQSTEFFWRVVILLRYVQCPGPWKKFLKILTDLWTFFNQWMEHWLWYLGLLGFSMQANTQWRKVQDRLEDDDRCSRLDKLDRLEVFQVWTHRNCNKSEGVCWNNDCCLMFWCPYLLLLHTNLQVNDAWMEWWPSSFINGRSTSEILKRRRKKRRNCKRWSIKFSWFRLVWMSMCSTLACLVYSTSVFLFIKNLYGVPHINVLVE